MAMATANPTPTTLSGHSHEFQYLKDEDQSQLTSQFTAADNEVSPADILAQLSAAEHNTQSVLSGLDNAQSGTTQEPWEASTPPYQRTPTKNNNSAPRTPPPAPVKQKDEFQYWNGADGAESVEISHLIAQQEQAPPSPIPYIPEDESVDEPFDCVPIDDSEDGILKQLEKVVQDSDRVLHPGASVVEEKMTLDEMAAMTPLRSGDPFKSPGGSVCGNSTVSGTTAFSRASVKITAKNKKPAQPIMKLRVNDYQFEPLSSVTNEVEDMPFDETTSHKIKTALFTAFAVTKEAALKAVAQASTPDTTMMEDSASDDDTTTNYSNDDEWTEDTSKYTDGTTEYTDTDEDTAVTMDTPNGEAPSKKSAKALRRQKLLAKARDVDKRSKEEMGWDEKLLDAVFSPGVTQTALEVADFLQSGAEVTISMTKSMLQDAVTQLEKEERELNGETILEEEDEELTDAGERNYNNIAAAATGSNLQGNEETDDNDTASYTQTEEQNGDDDTASKTQTEENGEEQVKDPWDQPQESFRPKQPSFADLVQKGLPLMNRKLERMINEWSKSTTEQEADGASQTAEDRVAAEAKNDEAVVEPEVPGESEEAVSEPFEAPAEAPEASEEEEKKDSEEEEQTVLEGSKLVMQQFELEDAQEAVATEEASLQSLEKPTKRLSV